jgi:hypothetical protein
MLLPLSFDLCTSIPVEFFFVEFCLLMNFDPLNTMEFYVASPWSHCYHEIDFNLPFVQLKCWSRAQWFLVVG